MKKVCALPVILFLLVASTGTFVPAVGVSAQQEQEAILYFQDFNSGSAPEWSLEPGWEIAPSEGEFALSGTGHVWARMQEGAWSDYFLRFRIKLGNNAALHANVRQTGAIRYFIGLNRQNSYLSKQTSLDKFQNGLASASGIGAGWHVIEIGAVGGTITLRVDNKKNLEYFDPEPLMSGGVAFESLADDVVWIDDVEVGEKLTAPPASAGTLAPTLPPNLKWVHTGGPLGGLGYDVRMRPDNPDIMFVTDAEAGVFKSTDGGKTWEPANQGITARTGETGEIIPIFCLTIDPHDPDIVWAGTQSQRGVFKSIDGGRSWAKRDNGITERGLTLRGFTVDPRTSNIVYAAGEVSSWEWNGAPMPGVEFDRTKGVVYKTTNGGTSWQKVWNGNDLARYIWIDPRNPEVIYVSTGIFDREAANSDPQSRTPGGVGIIKSTDGGKTWQTMNQGLRNLYVGSLFMHPQNPDILLAGVGNVTYPDGSGVYLSTDGGVTWRQTLDAYVINSVEISAANPDIAYAGSFNAIYRSEDGGQTWSQISAEQDGWGPDGIRGGQPIDFQADPRNPQRLFANAYGGGIFLSEDGGISWSDASHGYTGAMMRHILVAPDSPGHVFAVGRSGIFTSRDGGETWRGLAFAPYKANDWHTIAMDPRHPNHLLAELTCPRTMLQSTDGGKSWITVNQAPPRVSWRAIEFAPSDPATVYAGSAGFYSCGQFDNELPAVGLQVSHDGGLSWSDANDASSHDASVTQLAVHPQNAKLVFAATFNQGLLKTSDGGKSWQIVGDQTFLHKSMTAVKFFPDHPDTLLAGRFQGGLYRSEDGGQTWKMSTAGLNPEATVVDILFDPNDSRLIYLADLSSGVYRSTDSGKSWRAMSQGLSLRAINSLALSSDGQHLYAASEGQGVFRLDLNGQPPPGLLEPTVLPTQPLPSATPAQAEPTAPPNTSAPATLPSATTLPATEPAPQAGRSTLPPATEVPATVPAPKGGRPTLPSVCQSPIPLAVVAIVWMGLARSRHKKPRQR